MMGVRLIGAVKAAAKELAPSFVATIKEIRRARLHARVQKILDMDAGPDTHESEAAFDKLQQSFKPRKEYGYDSFSTWKRGAWRATQLIETMQRGAPGLNVLEAGCGDGMTGFLLAQYGYRVTLADMEDWRDVRAKPLPMLVGSLENGLAIESNTFDLVYSYNTFEHLNNPGLAMQELVRVCRHGGMIYLEFGPLYACPWGLHAYRALLMPYPQYLFSNQFIKSKLEELGIRDLGCDRTELQPLNMWTLRQFDGLWNQSCLEIANLYYQREENCLGVVLQFPLAFSGRGLTLDDLVTQGIYVTLRKPMAK